MHNKKIIIITLIITLLIMAGGYAVYSSSLKVEGTGSIDSNFNIEVTNIEEESKSGKAVSVTEPTYTSSTATFNTKLQRPGDNIEYKVEITNNGTVDGKINALTITNPSDIVKVETRGIIEGEIIKSGEVKSYIVRIYIEENAKLTEDVTSVVKVETEIIQDDNQIFNEGIDGTVENKLAIESTKEESDYTSIKATVTAKGNGLKYYYSLDNENWTDVSTESTHTFTGLEIGKRYTVYYKVEDENLNYVTDSKWINTKDIDSPVITISNENKWTQSKEVTIEYPEIEGAVYQYKIGSGEWQDALSSQKVEVTENTVVYAKIIYDGKEIESKKEVNKIDNETPILNVTTSKSTSSITVVADANALSGISKYEYSIDGQTWIDNTTYNNYTFKGLTHNTDYTVHSRVTSGSGKTTSSTVSAKTNLIETPTFEESSVAGSNTVTITFPSGCGDDLTCTYIKDSEDEVEVTTSTSQVEFTAAGTLIAKVNDGKNYITSSTLTVVVKYAITTSKNSTVNLTVSPSATAAIPNTNVTFTVPSSSSYSYQGAYVYNTSGTIVMTLDASTKSFTMPAYAVRIAPIFKYNDLTLISDASRPEAFEYFVPKYSDGSIPSSDSLIYGTNGGGIGITTLFSDITKSWQYGGIISSSTYDLSHYQSLSCDLNAWVKGKDDAAASENPPFYVASNHVYCGILASEEPSLIYGVDKLFEKVENVGEERNVLSVDLSSKTTSITKYHVAVEYSTSYVASEMYIWNLTLIGKTYYS